jgi:phage baseplate assembly protein W
VIDTALDFLGTGLAFPFHVEPDGKLAEVSYDDDIRQSIRIILGTEPGERVMRPAFGAGLNRFVFAAASTTMLERLRGTVHEALVRWEPRIIVEQVVVAPAGAARSLLLIDATYRVRATNTLQNLVYPFYLQEGAPSA